MQSWADFSVAEKTWNFSNYGCGTVGIADATDTRGPGFVYTHQQFL